MLARDPRTERREPGPPIILRGGTSATVNAMLRFDLLACLCAGLTGCAILPVAALNLAAQGAHGLVALTLGSLDAMNERSEVDRCAASAGKGIAISESLETTIPTDEGEVKMFELANWRLEFASEGYPQAERSRTPTEGTLAIGERSILLVPPPGTIMVRIPYALVQDVEIRSNAVTNEPGSMIVKSCYGRFDIVTIRQEQSSKLDPVATTAAATSLKTHLAAFRAAKGD